MARALGQVMGPLTHGGWLPALLPAGLFVAILSAGRGLTESGVLLASIAWVPTLGISLTFRLDAFSQLFALIITGIGVLVTIYAGAYFADAPASRRASFIALILLFMGAMLGTVLADDLIVLFLFWEATSLLSFLLIGFDSARPDARKAALQSLIVTAGGGLALFAGILLIGMALGTFSLSETIARAGELTASPLATPILVLILIGAFTKSAQVPFHFWLPSAMAAPTPASAYLHSATMVKLGVYLLARFDQVFATMPAFGTTLVIVGSATMAVAAIRALSADDYKAVLAHSTVGTLGLLVLLVGLDGEQAITATVVVLLAHALYKAALFFCAGTAIHATHENRLSRLGGLRGALPLTAAAAALAAASMAGLPPALGFIAKESFIDAQLHTAVSVVVTAITLAASAVLVAVAGIVGLSPFFRNGDARPPVHHGETAGLTIGPIVLGALGLLFGIAPATLHGLIEPAAATLLGRPVTVSLSLWHGLTPALGLSAMVLVAGAGIFAVRGRIHASLDRQHALTRALGDAGYDRVFDGTLRLATLTTRVLQNGDQHRYTATVVAAVLALTTAGLVVQGAPARFPLESGTFDPRSAIMLGLMAAGAIAATRAASLIRAMIAVGVVGFGSAVLYLLNGAPDLALTQFAVEVLVVLIFVALLLQIPDRPAGTRSPRERWRDALLAGGVGASIFIALATMVARPLDRSLTDYFAATSYLEAHGRNVVNVIIVDYRGIDTLGEISVVAFAATAVWGLLRRRRAPRAGSQSS